MVNSVSDIFKTEESMLLLWLSEHQSNTRDGPVIKYSQNELAGEFQRSPTTVNKWMQTLRKAGCIQSKKKGVYLLTNTGQKIIAELKRIETILANGQ